jgi:hypothetical protein
LGLTLISSKSLQPHTSRNAASNKVILFLFMISVVY